jgi:hypothetical protein
LLENTSDVLSRRKDEAQAKCDEQFSQVGTLEADLDALQAEKEDNAAQRLATQNLTGRTKAAQTRRANAESLLTAFQPRTERKLHTQSSTAGGAAVQGASVRVVQPFKLRSTESDLRSAKDLKKKRLRLKRDGDWDAVDAELTRTHRLLAERQQAEDDLNEELTAAENERRRDTGREGAGAGASSSSGSRQLLAIRTSFIDEDDNNDDDDENRLHSTTRPTVQGKKQFSTHHTPVHSRVNDHIENFAPTASALSSAVHHR